MSADPRLPQTFSLPFPPSANTYYRHVGYRVLISEDGRKYKQRVQSLLFNQFRCLDMRVGLLIAAHPPDNRRRDLDNMLKCLLDSMKGVVYRDDSQIDFLSIQRAHVVSTGNVEITLFDASFIPNQASIFSEPMRRIKHDA